MITVLSSTARFGFVEVALQKMSLSCQRRNLQEVISDHNIIQSCVDFLEKNNDGLRQKTRILGDFFFLALHPYRDFSIQTLLETLPRLAEVTDEEWISPKFFTQGSIVEIPQVLVIRSLKHVSGAVLVWEYTRQRVLGGAS